MKCPASTLPNSLALYAEFFPLCDIESILRFFRHILKNNGQRRPDLILISIVLGFFESSLHVQHTIFLQQQRDEAEREVEDKEEKEDDASETGKAASNDNADNSVNEETFPRLVFEDVEEMYQEFMKLMMDHLTTCDLSLDFNANSNADNAADTTVRLNTAREVIKAISDLLWKQLSRIYQKEKTHIQSVYSFLKENKLDSFGLAYVVVSVCQMLGFEDVTLALSEDHAWAVFGPEGAESAELTWHGRGQEDKRGLAVDDGHDAPAATSWLYLNGHPVLCRDVLMSVTAAVTSINPDNCRPLLGVLKRRLLWLLHEEAEDSPLQSYPLALLNLADLEAIGASPDPTPGADQRASPEQLYLQAIEVNRRVYANKHVYPYTFTAGYYLRVGRLTEALRYWADAAQVMSNFNYYREDEEIYKEFREIAEYQIPRLFTQDPQLRQDQTCLAHVLRFYDGICQWEEGSVTPVLHTGWADRFMSTLFKFEPSIRREIVLLDEEEASAVEVEETHEEEKEVEIEKEVEEEVKEEVKEEEKKNEESVSLSPPPVTLDILKAECGNQLINPAYLLGLVRSPAFLPANHPNPMMELAPLRVHIGLPRGAPASQPTAHEEEEEPKTKVPKMSPSPDVQPLCSISPLSMSNASSSPNLPPPPNLVAPPSACSPPPAHLHLRSEKMRGLKALLTSPRLNGSAIKLQLTAQSQIYLRRTDLDSAYPLPRKRGRRN